MKNTLDKIRSLFLSLGSKLKHKPKSVPATSEPPTSPRGKTAKRKTNRFTTISWALTFVIVVSLLGSALIYKSNRPMTYTTIVQQPTAVPSGAGDNQSVTSLAAEGSGGGLSSIPRNLQLKTNIPERPRYAPITYRVTRGDAMLAIADKFKIKYESILYVNKQLEDNPHNLRPGMELTIPPVDGLYYKWKEGDTFESVAKEFDAKAEDIINFPGNKIDLTNPEVKPGTTIMIPGGSRKLRNWEADLQTIARVNNGSTGTSDFSGNAACGGGPVATSFGWPADAHSLSGNGYGPGHLGIDITAPEGANIYAAGAGVVTMAQGGWNYGYGNVIEIDHGNGYVTVYAHLSVIYVSVCQAVGQGTLIGLAGATGNAFGSHLHFEIRIGGKNVNPYDIVQ